MNDTGGRRWREGACLFLTGFLVIAVMGLIFYFSSQNANHSSRLSEGVCTRLVIFLQQFFGKELNLDQMQTYIDILETPVRKCAHFAEYALFSYLTNFHALSWRVYLRKKETFFTNMREVVHGFAPMLWKTMPFCILYAASDEFHQLFVPGRAGRIFDIGVDSAGILCGVILFLLTVRTRKVRILVNWLKGSFISDGAKMI